LAIIIGTGRNSSGVELYDGRLNMQIRQYYFADRQIFTGR